MAGPGWVGTPWGSSAVTRGLAILLGGLVLGLDLVTKWWVQTSPWLHDHVVIEGLFRIHYVQNSGVAFGLFHSVQSAWKPVILSALAVVALVVVLFYIWTTPAGGLGQALPLGLLLGGILGNSIDRVLAGTVVDFLEVHWQGRYIWPTFNVADAAITCGVFAILYETVAGRQGPEVPAP